MADNAVSTAPADVVTNGGADGGGEVKMSKNALKKQVNNSDTSCYEYTVVVAHSVQAC